jgi:choline-sulfatase
MLSVKQAGIAEATNQLDFDDEVGFHALRFLKDYRRAGDPRPFFLVVSFTHPHDPYATREAYWRRYDDTPIPQPTVGPLPPERLDPHSRRLRTVSAMDDAAITEDDVRRARRAYFASISYLDDRLGELMTTLAAFGLADDTITPFTSDHGDLLGERGLWYKMHFFEWAARVPMIFHAPARFAPRRSTTLTSLLDLMPTLLDLGSIKAAPPLALDGQSLAPLLTGAAEQDRTVLGEYLAEGALAPIFMLRRGPHKFIWSAADPPLLFDLEQDPDELENLAATPAHAELVAALTAKVHERWDPQGLYAAVLESQRARRLTYDALARGRRTPWEYQPNPHPRPYVTGSADLTDLEHRRRFPPPPR